MPPKVLAVLVSFHTPVPVLVKFRLPAPPLSVNWPAKIFGLSKVPPAPPRRSVPTTVALGRMMPVLVMFSTAPDVPEASRPPLTVIWKSLFEL